MRRNELNCRMIANTMTASAMRSAASFWLVSALFLNLAADSDVIRAGKI